MGFGIEVERPWKTLLESHLTNLSPNEGTLCDLEVNVPEDCRVWGTYLYYVQPTTSACVSPGWPSGQSAVSECVILWVCLFAQFLT